MSCSSICLSLARKAKDAAVYVAGFTFHFAEARRSMRLVSAMSDRELRDIGLTRADVGDAAALPMGVDPGRLFQARARERHEGAMRSDAVVRPWGHTKLASGSHPVRTTIIGRDHAGRHPHLALVDPADAGSTAHGTERPGCETSFGFG